MILPNVGDQWLYSANFHDSTINVERSGRSNCHGSSTSNRSGNPSVCTIAIHQTVNQRERHPSSCGSTNGRIRVSPNEKDISRLCWIVPVEHLSTKSIVTALYMLNEVSVIRSRRRWRRSTTDPSFRSDRTLRTNS